MPSSAERLIAGRYRLLAVLGRGGMGVVWRARDEYLQRDVAVKEILLPDGLDDATRTGLLERFVREARAAARLDHPAIISVYDVVTEHELPWIVMHLVRGRSLDQLVRERGPLPPDRVATVGLQVLDALDTAHAEGILHRDVTPRNVLVGDGDRIVLTDFGIASMDGATALTQTGALIGSPGYIAPERLRGRPAGPESDLWSLGAVLYFAVESLPAYTADEVPALLGMVLTEQPAPLTRAGPLTSILEELLIKDPAARLNAKDARRRLRVVTKKSDVTGPVPGTLTTASPCPGNRTQGTSRRSTLSARRRHRPHVRAACRRTVRTRWGWHRMSPGSPRPLRLRSPRTHALPNRTVRGSPR
jgi:serine/threonine protein kinase